jgi:hypothetical protein
MEESMKTSAVLNLFQQTSSDSKLPGQYDALSQLWQGATMKAMSPVKLNREA